MRDAVELDISVLHLIAAGVPLEAVLDVIEGRGETGEVSRSSLAELRNAAADVYAARASDRRRLRGMDLLNDTALDLVSIQELDEVLAAICRRARRLLDTDVAYITLIDGEERDTYIRATDGIVSEEFRRMRLPFGVGLGGLVAAEGSQATTADYGADERFAHSSEIDHIVAAEGLRAIAGVPLRHREAVIGVLMSGSRSVRQFDPAELALFESLAALAAVAIENARLFKHARSTQRDLEHAGAQSRRAAALLERLAALAVAGAGASELTGAAEEVVGGNLILIEHDGDHESPADDRGAVRIEVAAGADHLADLMWEPPANAAIEQDAQLLRRGAAILAGQLLSQRARTEANYRRRSELVSALFDEPDTDSTVIQREAGGLGLSLVEPHIVAVADLPPGRRWAWLRAAQESAEEGGISRAVRGRVTLVLPGDDPATVAARWERILCANGVCPTLGIGAPGGGLEAIRRSYGEAVASLNLLRSLGRSGVTLRSDQLGLLPLVFAQGRSGEVRRFVEHILGPVLENDARRREPILIPTLEQFFNHGGRVSRAARELGVHVNTLYQRLERIEGLLGEDWRSADRSLEIQVALRARGLLVRQAETAE